MVKAEKEAAVQHQLMRFMTLKPAHGHPFLLVVLCASPCCRPGSNPTECGKGAQDLWSHKRESWGKFAFKEKRRKNTKQAEAPSERICCDAQLR